MQFFFGKYKGQEVCDTPTAYLKWVEENFKDLDPNLRRAINDELKCRSDEGTPGRDVESPTFKPFEEMIYDCMLSWLTQECNAGRMIVPSDKKEALQVSLVVMLKREVPIKLKLFRAQRREK